MEGITQVKPMATGGRDLQQLLKDRNPSFFSALVSETREASNFSRILALNTLRRKGSLANLIPDAGAATKIAIIGGPSLRPIGDLIEHFVSVLCGLKVELWTGDYDNYVSEILDAQSDLYEFGPQIVVVLPSEARCTYDGGPLDDLDVQMTKVDQAASGILQLCGEIHDQCGAQVILANFRLSPYFDPGPMRYTNFRSDYAFRKAVNTQLGVRAPAFLQICDVEFLANRLGTLTSQDPRTWFESKQPYSTDLMVVVAREVSKCIELLRQPPKKLVILDLDNTLWGGVIGDDGLGGIEIGTTSPRGEAYREFQKYLKSLTERGILLAVASKNDHDKAIEPFTSHPEMVLKLEDFVSFKANWEPKSENIRQMATELSLGLDSFVFVDDNPAEIEIVRQFVPEVTVIWVGDDPSSFTATLKDARLFEMRSITDEDTARSSLYRQEAKRQALQSTTTDMGSYLASLEMTAQITPFNGIDAPRISQLINKSNQFNLTTRRRTEAEVQDVITDRSKVHFTLRLSDRFGAHGLVAIVIGQIEGDDLRIDTWLMSCRVLKRQVEEVTLNEIVARAKASGVRRVIGDYLPTVKNGMVSQLYPQLGFALLSESAEGASYGLDVDSYLARETAIAVSYGS